MVFNSVTFIVFLYLVVTLYWLLPKKVSLWMLLVASLTFYGFWRPEFLIIMILSAMTDYFTAIAIYNTPKENRRRRNGLLSITLVVNLGLLVYFKYLMFFTTNLEELLHAMGMDAHVRVFNIILPFGISFYTFETISYTVDVYRGLIKPERNPLTYSLFVAFFPKLVAGPIQRANELIVQFKTKTPFSVNFLAEGIKRILYGLFLKVVLADNISPIVDECYNSDIHALSALDTWTMAFLFGFQIYFDFAAYSHIALGSAKLMGINIPENFNFPYAATSLKDFWKRWHISLSSWIRDYLYLPLCGIKVIKSTGAGGIGDSLDNKKITSESKKDFALFLTWTIMGLWHGANWTFVCWGVYFAFFIFLERQFSKLKSTVGIKTGLLAGWAITLCITMLSWIPFRAKDITTSFAIWEKLLHVKNYTFLSFRENTYLVASLCMLLFLIAFFADKWGSEYEKSAKIPALVFSVAKFTVIMLLVFTFLRPISQFIYFQF